MKIIANIVTKIKQYATILSERRAIFDNFIKNSHYTNGNTWCYNINHKKNMHSEGNYMFNALGIAKYVVYKCAQQDNQPISNLQLQKILYYIQGYFLKTINEEAYCEEIYNWPYGPVVPEVYFEYNMYGNSKIDNNYPESDEDISLVSNNFNCRKLIDKVISACVALSPSRLVECTHMEDPWKNTKRSQIIEKYSIQEYFKDNDPLGIMKA